MVSSSSSSSSSDKRSFAVVTRAKALEKYDRILLDTPFFPGAGDAVLHAALFGKTLYGRDFPKRPDRLCNEDLRM